MRVRLWRNDSLLSTEENHREDSGHHEAGSNKRALGRDPAVGGVGHAVRRRRRRRAAPLEAYLSYIIAAELVLLAPGTEMRSRSYPTYKLKLCGRPLLVDAL